MKIDPLGVLFEGDFSFDKNFYYIGGNEITLMEKILNVIIERFKNNGDVGVFNIDSIDNFVDEGQLFSTKKILIGKNCKGINNENLNKLKNTNNIFIFFQENSTKTKSSKNIFAKKNDAYLIDCYELDRGSKIKVLNNFIKDNDIKIEEEVYWLLVEKLDTKYFFVENSLVKLKGLSENNITKETISKILTLDDGGKEKIFFYLFKKNNDIIEIYKNKVLTTSDVSGLYFYIKSFCQLILESRNENEFISKVPKYLFKEKKFLIEFYKKYNFKKRKLLLNLLYKTEKTLRINGSLSIILGLRFVLSLKKITVS